MTTGAFSFGRRFNTIVIAKSNMNDSTLVRGHRTKLNATLLTGRTICARMGDRLKLLTLARFITLNINDNRISETDRPDSDSGNKELEGVEGFPMAANQNSKITAGNIENKLAFIAFVFVNRNFANIEMLQDILKNSNGSVGDMIEFFFGNFGILGRFHFFRFGFEGLFRILFVHFIRHSDHLVVSKRI